ncbi:MAG: alanine--tRNA ligase [Anaerolineaceae bacterium]|nr:alanine--tRNA ligase [Anaerolineaceae bacterium]
MKSNSGSEIRDTFINFFEEKAHKYVPSASLVPGGDATLLFTNAGMVQFKDVFLGTDERPYIRAVNSQKCMRVAGKHNDLDEVGRDDTHHTFFEMLGNWSFGDYYKEEAISWAWELLTEVWGLDKSKLWASYFKDELDEIETDDEAYQIWKKQPGINEDQIVPFGRADNLWEMAEVGPCGPSSEIHYDLGAEACNKQGEPGHICGVNGDCARYLEIWNLVFIQYNRIDEKTFKPLPKRHVDTGMGFERIVSILQQKKSNYLTDLLYPSIQAVQDMTGHTDAQVKEHFTPYRVIADHVRATTFLIGDGVVPGNMGRNYICRMIIRRASRFGRKLGLNEPFMAKVAEKIVDSYGSAYPELAKNRETILENLTHEEIRFHKTLDSGMKVLEELMEETRKQKRTAIDGAAAFDLYATNGFPMELTRDIAREAGLEVDEKGYFQAMEAHRVASGAGKAFGAMIGDDVDIYRSIFEHLSEEGKLPESGVLYDPYEKMEWATNILAIVKDGTSVQSAAEGDQIDVVIPETHFYVESGGQVNDTGTISGSDWEIRLSGLRKPAAGIIVHSGALSKGSVTVNDSAIAAINKDRRQDIMRNHTATHLLHAALKKILGDHARQAGSLVAPEKLRFDFNHSSAMSADEISQVEDFVNEAILGSYSLQKQTQSLDEAIKDGATALFGEKYGDVVRSVSIGEGIPFSYELCGGTHVDNTADIGLFIITSEGSAAAGIRRIEAVTGTGAYQVYKDRMSHLRNAAKLLDSTYEQIPLKIEQTQTALTQLRKENQKLVQHLANDTFSSHLEDVRTVKGISVLAMEVPDSDVDSLRNLTDQFREKYAEGVVVLGTVKDNRPLLIAAVGEPLIKKGIHAGNIIKEISTLIGGSGGGRPNLAQAGGKDPSGLPDALEMVYRIIEGLS